MSAHSNLVGGSTAGRFIACPGSRSIIESMPDSVDRPSSYATEGSALHQVVAEILLNGDKGPEDYIDSEIVVKDEGAVKVTTELVNTCIKPALDWFDHAIPETARIEVEARVSFPGIEGAFGTCDLVAYDPGKRSYVNDWKFGSGVLVSASYPDPDDEAFEIINPQLLFYACGARKTFPQMFPKDIPIDLSIVQPRGREGDTVSTVTVSHQDLDDFETALQAAVKLSELPDAPIKLGDHCRFAVCRTACPLHLAPLIDFQLDYPTGIVSAFKLPEVLADIMNLADMIEPVIIEARRQAHELMEAGGTIPGYKLVPKRATRKWALEEPFILKALRKLKVNKNQAYAFTLKSPAQIEKLLPKGKDLPEDMVEKISSGTTIAKDSDNRPEAETIGATISGIVGLLDTDQN